MNIDAKSMRFKRLNLIQGECRVSAETSLVITTVLGSCVAACIHDPIANVGGMNHFLLPEGTDEDSESLRYGAHAMELLVNGLLTLGAKREQLGAKLFGGARLSLGLTDVGSRNVTFARNYLRREGIRYLGGSTGGICARKIQYWPASGRARQAVLSRAMDVEIVQAHVIYGGEVELF
jgi:chemotaxis protein CheD